MSQVFGFAILIVAVFLFWWCSSLAPVFLFVLILVLLAKLLALVEGIRWIWKNGEMGAHRMRTREQEVRGQNPDPSPSQLRQIVFDELGQHPCWFWPFGVMDWKWLSWINHCQEPGDGNPSWGIGLLLQLTRDAFFRYESLMLLSTLLLLTRQYTPNDNWDATEWLSVAVSVVILAVIAAMSIEVLFGNVIMGDGYSRYCFRRLVSRTVLPTDRRLVLREVGYFSRLVLFSLLAIAVSMLSFHAISSSFHGIDGFSQSVDGFQYRAERFGEFLAFTCTTFATVGYGDVYPNVLGTRLYVGAFHILTMGMVLVLLQVVLGHHRAD